MSSSGGGLKFSRRMGSSVTHWEGPGTLWDPKAPGPFGTQRPQDPLGPKGPRTLWDPKAPGPFGTQRPRDPLGPKGPGTLWDPKALGPFGTQRPRDPLGPKGPGFRDPRVYTRNWLREGPISYSGFLIWPAGCMVICIVGGYWLSRTLGLQDLVFNAAALAFVLDLDELTYRTIVPSAAHAIFNRLEALLSRSYARQASNHHCLLGFCDTLPPRGD